MLIRVFPASVIAPPKRLTPVPLVVRAPLLPMPVPANVSASAPMVTPPATAKVAPLSTTVPAAVLPSAELWEAVSVPAETRVSPA